MKPRIIVSACLLGENCKYNGKNNKCSEAVELNKYFEIIPVCPECFGGLSIPREPAEIKDGRVYQKNGNDVTKEFFEGAEQTLYIAEEKNCVAALMKENSPSCGFGKIYDGSFSGKLAEGNGIAAEMLYKAGIEVFGESKISKLTELYS
jgi:uncharacterized protein YbbK (DUF523 family)